MLGGPLVGPTVKSFTVTTRPSEPASWSEVRFPSERLWREALLQSQPMMPFFSSLWTRGGQLEPHLWRAGGALQRCCGHADGGAPALVREAATECRLTLLWVTPTQGS